MSDQILILITLVLIVATAVGLGYSVVRLRRETRLSPRTWLLGAGVPLIATLGYLLLGGPPFHVLVVAAVGAVGLAITAATSATRRAGPPRQAGITLATWSVVYVIAALTAFVPRADSQALMAVLLAFFAGLAAGTQVGQWVSARRGMVPAPAMAQAAGWAPGTWSAEPAPVPTPSPMPAPPVQVPAPPVQAPTPSVQAPAPAPIAAPVEPAAALAPTQSAPPTAAPPPPPRVEAIHFTHSGQRFLFGYTSSSFGIWDLANRQGALAQFVRTLEGRAMAWSQFSAWEPRNTPVVPYPGLALEPIADAPVTFTNVGVRFALGRTADGHGIWDRWSPGPPVARFGLDVQSAAQAWQTFSSWEPRAPQL